MSVTSGGYLDAIKVTGLEFGSFVELPASKISLAKRKLIKGKGVNDSDYIISIIVNDKRITCPYYQSWSGMLDRCYSDIYQDNHPTYKGCSVTGEWLTFSNFKRWMEKQDWKGKQLDKDLLVQGNKAYGPEQCVFVTVQLNTLFNDKSANRGKYPQGVSFNKRIDKFQASIRINNKKKHIGYFGTPREARTAYKVEKYDHIKQVALEQTDLRVRASLLNWDLGYNQSQGFALIPTINVNKKEAEAMFPRKLQDSFDDIFGSDEDE
ncbi:MAG TPA: hypothetical protein EYN54_02145 [Methylococcaceae bacterium]|nr:hypothetical protein [Methylococcaceae bacterium]